jgi:deoxyribose-phosphate aldolase
VRTLEDLQKMVEGGATRIGASAGVRIIQQLRSGKSPAASGASSGDKY